MHTNLLYTSQKSLVHNIVLGTSLPTQEVMIYRSGTVNSKSFVGKVLL